MTKQPSYRFTGYTEPWEEKKLGEYAKYRRGSFPQPYGKKEWYGGEDSMPFVQVIDVTDNLTLVNDTKQKISKQAQPKSVLAPEGTVIVTLQGSIGRVAITHYDTYVDRTLLIFESYNFPTHVGFWAYTIQNKFEIERQKAPGGTIKTITKEALSIFEISLPFLPEQTAIGSFFQDIDQFISLQQRKLEVLKEQKKTYLKLLFPAKGQTKPALRFAGFEDEWKEVKLGEVTNRYDNLRVPVSANERISGDTPYYGANGIQDYVDGYTHDGEFILIAEDGASDLKDYPVQYVNGKVWVNNHAHVIQGKKDLINNIFLLFAVKQINIEPFLVGGGRAKLNSDIMMKLPLYLPTLPEQEVIGSFFQDLDKAIGKQEEKVNQLKESKQSLLRKMFI